MEFLALWEKTQGHTICSAIGKGKSGTYACLLVSVWANWYFRVLEGPGNLLQSPTMNGLLFSTYLVPFIIAISKSHPKILAPS